MSSRSDCDGYPANVFTRDEMLDNVMLYWLPGTGASSARLYWESFGKRIQDPVCVPAGASIFPMEQPAAFVDEVRAAFRLFG